MYMLTICSTVFAIAIVQVSAVRVCYTFLDYFNPLSPNCYDNPDSERNVTEIVRNWGFTVEEYNVTTEDGYQISVLRIYTTITKKTPIIFGHGIYMNSAGFVSSSHKTFVYQFVRNGYQVFLINYRGTLYSKVSKNYTQDDRNYWNFSFHEMGIYDLPKALELVKTKTDNKSIYIGFSMGTTISYVYTSLKPKDALDKLVGIISLAPVATLNNIPSILGPLAPLWPFVRPFIEALWNGQVLPRNTAIGRICGSSPILMYLCETFLRLPFFGDDYQQLDPFFLPVTFIQNTDTIGINVVEHFSQLIKSGQFQQFDHGTAQNLVVYGNAKPPVYNETNIPVPVALFVGRNDWLATVENARALYPRLQYKCGYKEVNWDKWNHGDFITAKDLKTYLIDDVISKANNMSQQLCT